MHIVDQLLNISLSPLLSRVADLLELQIVMSDPGPYYDKLGARKGLALDISFDERAAQIERLCEAQTMMTKEDFFDEAHRLAERRLQKRYDIQQDKFRKQQRDLAMIAAMAPAMEAGAPVDALI